jgi:hypothetical protein
LRTVEEIIDFFQIGRIALQLVLDHSPSPSVRGRITNCPGNPFEMGELVDLSRQGKLEWIELNRVTPLQVPIAIPKTANIGPISQTGDLQESGRNCLQALR